MNKLTKYIITTAFLLFTTTTTQATTSADLEGLLNPIHTMRADFTQTIYDNHNKVVDKSIGKMAMQRPGKFRWQVTKPIPQLIIANATKLWIYDPDLEQVTIRTIKKAAGETPALLLSHVDTTLESEFTIKQMPAKSPGSHWFTLIPKKTDSTFANVQMGFMNGAIQEMRLQDNLGHTTRIQFQHAEINAPLSGAMFVFKAPANVDVINEAPQR